MKAKSRISRTISAAAAFGIAAVLCFTQGAMAQSVASNEYVITGSGTLFTVTKYSPGSGIGSTVIAANQPIQSVINAIKADVVGATFQYTVKFGNGTTALNVGEGDITFDGWGPPELTGKLALSSFSAIYLINGASVMSSADITSTGALGPIINESTGTLHISGGTVSNSMQGGMAIHNYGDGRILVSGGAKVLADGADGIAIYNSVNGSVAVAGGGGTMVSAASGTAIKNGDVRNNSGGTVTVTLGTVSTTSGTAIASESTGSVTINGGTVSATTGSAIYSSRSGAININGGTVSVTGANSTAISSGFAGVSAPITISGGRVLAREGYAVRKGGTGAVNVAGGIVFACGTKANDVINGDYTLNNFSMIIAWNKAAGRTSYTKSTDTDLFSIAAPPPIPPVSPAIAMAPAMVWTVVWDTPDRIAYNYDNLNKGFIEIDGVTVTGGGTSVQTPSRVNSTNPAQFVQASGRTLQVCFADRGNVAIYALNGAKVRAFDLGSGSHTLRLNDLPRGTYMVRATGGAWKQSARVVVR